MRVMRGGGAGVCLLLVPAAAFERGSNISRSWFCAVYCCCCYTVSFSYGITSSFFIASCSHCRCHVDAATSRRHAGWSDQPHMRARLQLHCVVLQLAPSVTAPVSFSSGVGLQYHALLLFGFGSCQLRHDFFRCCLHADPYSYLYTCSGVTAGAALPLLATSSIAATCYPCQLESWCHRGLYAMHCCCSALLPVILHMRHA